MLFVLFILVFLLIAGDGIVVCLERPVTALGAECRSVSASSDAQRRQLLSQQRSQQ
jgi:hypothetical protein